MNKFRTMGWIGAAVVLQLGCTSGPRLSVGDSDARWKKWKSTEGGNDHQYLAVLVPQGISWFEADKAARAQGGYLATITSEEENAFVLSLLTRPGFFNGFGSGPLLGGYQALGAAEPAGGWGWITGEPWIFTNWYDGGPDNSGQASVTADGQLEDRLHYFMRQAQPGPTWNDLGLHDANTTGYVIERTK